MSHNMVILSHSIHPLYEKLKGLSLLFIDIDSEEVRITPETELIFDCTLLGYEEKEVLLSKFNSDQLKIISDTSCLNGKLLLEKKLIYGAMALSFPSPKNACEFYCEDSEVTIQINTLLSALGLQGVRVTTPGIGFIYPRVISQIINEVYFALEENLATPEAIDTAMKFGVNYPIGPLEWGKTIGTLPIVLLLDELLNTTGDNRYICSQKLRDEL